MVGCMVAFMLWGCLLLVLMCWFVCEFDWILSLCWWLFDLRFVVGLVVVLVCLLCIVTWWVVLGLVGIWLFLYLGFCFSCFVAFGFVGDLLLTI